MTQLDSFPYVWAVFGALAAGLVSVITVWLLVKDNSVSIFLCSESNQSEDYVVRGAAENTGKVRAVVGVLAVVLGVSSLWILVAELESPRLSYFPSNPDEASAMFALGGSAITAAQVGMIRGDLWTTAAMTTTAPLLFGATNRDQVSQAYIEYVRPIVERAARLSPHDSRGWLVLASLEFMGGGDARKETEALKLSYYTGPNELSLVPARLLLAVGSNAIADEDVQTLAPLDIQRIIRQPDLKPSIALAYKSALPKGRAIIEAALKVADPGFLATIASPGAPDIHN